MEKEREIVTGEGHEPGWQWEKAGMGVGSREKERVFFQGTL